MAPKTVVFLCCFLVSVLAGEKYIDKYDNINVQEILENERLLKAFVDCLQDRGPCTPEGKELKDHLRDALETGCEKCTDAQKTGAETVIDYVIKHKLEIWNEVANKYDPKKIYRKKYEDEARSRGITIPE